MTVSSTTNKSPLYTTPGVGPYSFNFKVFSPSDVIVIRRLVYGGEQIVPNNQYTVSLNDDQNSNPGGFITLQPDAALVAGQKLLIIRSLEATQGVDIQNAGGFYPEVIESALDKLTMLIQNVQEELSRALKVGPTSTISANDLLNQLMSGGNAPNGVVDVQTFPTSGTWYKPAAGTMALIECWGGGGSGSPPDSYMKAGGCGGLYASRLIPLVDLPSSVDVTVGLGGAPAMPPQDVGNDGGDTSFGSYLIAHGGRGGRKSPPVGRAGGGNPSFYGGEYSLPLPGQSNPISGGGALAYGYISAGYAGNSYWGGGGGGIYPGDGLHGISIMGGNGSGGNGFTPGGGGGCGFSGGDGFCRVTVF